MPHGDASSKDVSNVLKCSTTDLNRTAADVEPFPRLGAETFVSVPGSVSQLRDAPGCSTSTVRLSWTASAVAPTHVSVLFFFSSAFLTKSFRFTLFSAEFFFKCLS